MDEERLPGCADGDYHVVLDPEDPNFDRAVLARYDAALGPRPNNLWSYCRKCEQGFRWSVLSQQWRPWPGGLGLLPHYTDEELDELAMAIVRRMDELGNVVPIAQATGTRREINYKLVILNSLLTSVAECRHHLA